MAALLGQGRLQRRVCDVDGYSLIRAGSALLVSSCVCDLLYVTSSLHNHTDGVHICRLLSAFTEASHTPAL